jgi:hypothetical protein
MHSTQRCWLQMPDLLCRLLTQTSAASALVQVQQAPLEFAVDAQVTKFDRARLAGLLLSTGRACSSTLFAAVRCMVSCTSTHRRTTVASDAEHAADRREVRDARTVLR